MTDELFARLKEHWNDAQIVEITAAIALNGFLNRWSDSLAVPLEPEPKAFAEKHLAHHGWQAGRHA